MFHRSLYSFLTFAAVAAPLAAQRTEVYTVPPAGEARGMGYSTMTASRRAVIGVTITTRPTDGDTLGATIAAVTPGGGAAQAGILAGDIITKFNGTALAERRSRGQHDDEVAAQSGPGLKLIELVSRVAPGDTVTVEWRHERQRKTGRIVTQSAGNVWVMGDSGVRVFTAPRSGTYTYEFGPPDRERALIELQGQLEHMRTPMPLASMGPDRFFFRMGGPLGGVQFAPINADLGRYFGVTDGILVLETPDTSTHVDLKGGDVIISVGGDRKPTSVEHLFRILGSYTDDETVNFEVMRDKRRVTVSAKAEDVRGGGRMKVIEERLMPSRVPATIERDAPAPTTAPRARTPRSGT